MGRGLETRTSRDIVIEIDMASMQQFPSNRRDGEAISVARLAGAMLIVLSAYAGMARGQASPAVIFELRPEAAQIEGCVESELRIALRLRNPGKLPVAGYQMLLRFPAASFTAAGFEPGAISGFHIVNAPAPLGGGFPTCAAGIADPWGDGLGSDVLSVSASAYGLAGGAPVALEDAVLGVARLRIRDGAASGVARLALEFDGCQAQVGQSPAVYGADGRALSVIYDKPVATVQILEPVRVRELACTRAAGGAEVQITWQPPAGANPGGYAVYRNGEVIRSLVPAFLNGITDAQPPAGALRYEVAVVQQGREARCRASCLLEAQGEIREFTRGDSNGDGRRNISDPIATLGFLFQGTELSCHDGADVDDNGELDITDGIALLEFLFLDGPPPKPPFPGVGLDPTPDRLGCEPAA